MVMSSAQVRKRTDNTYMISKPLHEKGSQLVIRKVDTGAASTHVCGIINQIGRFNVKKKRYSTMFQNILYLPSQYYILCKRKVFAISV
jgi:hypothetical protein